MYTVVRTNSQNADFQKLVIELDQELAIHDGDEHAFFDQFNKISDIKFVVVIYENDRPLGCGAIKAYEKNVMEIKRMYVSPEKRGNGIGSLILQELEKWALELFFKKCILETGHKQTEALALYKKNNYTIIPNYGQYINVTSSICFQKLL